MSPNRFHFVLRVGLVLLAILVVTGVLLTRKVCSDWQASYRETANAQGGVFAFINLSDRDEVLEDRPPGCAIPR